MNDSELLKAILDLNAWTQQELSRHLLFDRTQVSRVLNGKTHLRPLTREKAEQLLAEAEQQQQQQQQHNTNN